MNKIYRVVWNETTQTWNAVAEFAKAHGKTASSGIGGIVASVGVRFAFTAIMSGLLLASGQAVATVENNGKTLANGTVLSAAADGTDYNTCYFDTVSYNVVCGDDTTKALDFIPQTGGQPPKQGKSVAIGQGAQTSGESNVAIGPKTVTANTGSIAIGVAASANHNQSIAMGQEASAKGEADVSIGKLAGDTVSSDGRNISIGESALKGGSGVNNVIAIGSSAGINSNSSHSVYIGTGATGMDPKNISIGYQANTKSGSIAVGDNSNAQGSSSVAIGTKSVVTDVASNGVAIGFNSTTSGLSAVAIGGSSSTGKGANASGPASLAIMGTAVASAPRAISIGEFTVGSGAYGIAIGGKANAQGTSSIAIGGSQAQDKGATAAGHFSTAIGYGAKTVNQDTTAVGKNSTANGLRATAFGVDSNAGAENALAAGPQTTASAKGAIAVGFATQATGLSSIAVGKEAIATTETSTSLGQNSKATANNAVAIGNKAVAAGTGNIVVGTNAGVYDDAVSAGRKVGADTVYIGADSGRNAYTNERQISIGKGTGNNATGVDNIALGLSSGAFVVGTNNVAIGKEAGMGTDAQKLSVTSTVAIGEAAKGSFSNTVAIGKTALAEKESAVAVGMVSKASGDNSVAIGKTANASAHETVAIGHETVAGAVSSVAVGQRANASGSEAVALGIDSNASGKFAVAIGNMAKVTDSKLNGIAIGSNAVASEDYAMAMGLDTQATGNSSIAFGNTAKALGKEAVAFGHLATAAKNNTLAFGVSSNSAEVGAVTLGAYTKADAVTGTALGYSAHAVNENDVALGGGSLTEAHHSGDYTLNGNYTAAGTWSYGTVSVGKVDATTPANNFTRQIQNVSAGVISATSTDAINGSQLYATNSYLLNLGNNVKNALGGKTAIDGEGNLTLNDLGGTGKANVHDALEAMNNKINQLGGGLGGGSSSHFYSVQTASNTRGNYNNDGATGLDALAAGADAQAAGEFAVAVGTGAQAAISNSIAIGRNATVNADTASDVKVHGLTKGEGSVAIGSNTKASGTNATAVGQSSNAYGQNSLAAGQSSNALGKSSVALGDGANATQDSATALGPYSQSTAAGATALGFNTRATAFGTVAAGRNSKAVANNAVAMGNEADAQREDTIAIGYNAQATQNRAVAFGKNAKATAGDTVAFGDAAKASVGNAIAFGKNANAAHADSIALGANSATEAAVQTTSATVGSLTFGNFAGNTPESTLSIGTAGKERTITNVAAGRISDSSTDAVNGSQLYATQNVMNNIGKSAVSVLGGNAAIANDGTITMTNIGGTGASTIEGAISAINNASYKSFKLNTAKTSGTNGEANNHSLKEITNGSTITLEAGKNIVLNQNESTVSINTADAPEFAGKITAKGGLDMSNTKITNLGKGEQPTDAVNLSQLTDAINNVHVTTLTAVTNEAPFAYVSADGRILKRNVTVDGSGAKQVSFVYADDTSTPYNGAVTIAALNPTDPQTTVPTQVGNVAAGKGQNDAVNVSQLDKVAQALGTSVNNATGEIAAPKYSVISGSPATSGVADYNNVGDALTALSNAVRAPLTFAGDSGTPSTRQLGSTVTVKGGEADEAKLSANNIGVVSDDINGTLNVKLAKDLQGLNSARFDADGSSTTINGGNVTLVGKDGEVNASTAEGNTLTDQDGNTTKSIAGITELTDEAGNTNLLNAKGIELSNTDGGHSAFKADGSSISDKNGNKVDTTATGITLTSAANGGKQAVSLTQNGLNNGGNKITKVAKGTDDTDAVNVAQLNEQLAATEKTTTVVASKNVTVSEKVDGNNTEYTVNADKTTLSQAANGAVKVSEGAKDADGVTDYALDLTDEAKADIAKGVAAKDAVDNKGLTFAADNGTTGAKKLGDSLSVKGDGNILTRADENGIGFSLADKITVGKAGKGNKPLVIDGTAGLISGLSNTTLGGADFATKGQAASEEQLNAAQANLANLLGGNAANDKGNVTTTDIGGTGKDNVHDAIAAVKETADKGWNLNANDETSSEKIGAGDTVTFKEGKNVKVSRNGKHITVATSDDVSFDKVTVGGSVLTDKGLTVGNGKAGKPVSLTKDGLNNGGNKVTDIAAGEADTDAVNVAQLKAAAAKATSKVDSGNDNIVVTPKQNADGSTTYTVATAPNLKADSFTAGDVNITADGINAGNKAISNVAEGKKDTDAVNVGQLNRLTAAAKTEVEAGTNIASVSSKQGANGQTVYTVNADGASVSAGSDNIVVTKGNKDANNVTDYAVDLSKAVKADIAKGVAAKDAVDNKGISFAGDSGTTVANKLGDTVAVKGDANITTTAGANGIQVGLNKDLKVDSVKAGDTVVNNNGVNVGYKVALSKDGLKAGDVNITAEGINAGGKKVTGVAAGTVAAGSTDAVNGGQLHQMYELIGSNGGNVNTAPPSVEADGKAGLGNIKNITLVDNSNNPNVTNVTNETKIAQSNGYSLVTYNVEDQGMYVTNNVIEAVGRMNEQGIKFFHTNDGEVNPDVQAYNSEDSSASGAYATAVGYQAASKGTNAIAIGKGAKANAENTIAIGTGNIVSGKNSGAIGDPTVVSGNSSYSIGNNNNVSADNAYALGSNIKATVKDSVYLGDRAQTQGIHTADAAKGEAYTYGGLNDKAVAGKAGSAAAANKVAGVVTVGNGTDETRQVQGVAAGVVSADSTDAINGSQLYYTNQAIANVATQATAAKTEVTAGKNVVVNQTTGNSGQTVYNVATADKLDVTSVTAGGVTVNAQGVSIAAPTANNPSNTVSLSPIGLNNGGQRITNVAPAKEGTDAVNLNQLAGVGNALQNNIERVGKKAYAGVAGAIAQGSIPQVTRPGATGIGVGSGYYGGQSAMAIGVSAMSDGGNWVVKGNFSANTDGHVGVGAGALYQW